LEVNVFTIDFHQLPYTHTSTKQQIYHGNVTQFLATIHLKKYLEQRTDTNPALFVSLHEPHTRLTISGVCALLQILFEVDFCPCVEINLTLFVALAKHYTLAFEVLRDSCQELRDIAMIDLLLSTGMRVGELVKINREDITSTPLMVRRVCGSCRLTNKAGLVSVRCSKYFLRCVKIDTTLHYAMVNQTNVKIAHRKFLN